MAFDYITHGTAPSTPPSKPSFAADVVNNDLYIGYNGHWNVAGGSLYPGVTTNGANGLAISGTIQVGNEALLNPILQGYTNGIDKISVVANSGALTSGLGIEVDQSAGAKTGVYIAALGSPLAETFVALEVDQNAPVGALGEYIGLFGYSSDAGITSNCTLNGVAGIANPVHTGTRSARGVVGLIEMDASVSEQAAAFYLEAARGIHAADANVYGIYSESSEPNNLGGGKTTMGNVIVSAMPTADPHVVGQLWNSSGTVHVSAG